LFERQRVGREELVLREGQEQEYYQSDPEGKMRKDKVRVRKEMR